MVFPSDEKTPQTPGAQPVQQSADGANGQGYVTRDELDQFEGRLKELLSGNFQAVQSQTDRYQDRVQKALTEFKTGLEAMRASGIDVSPAQVEQAQNKVILDALAKQDATAPAAQNLPTQDALYTEYLDTVTAAAESMMDLSGIQIEDDDPEVEIIEAKATAQPREYLAAVKQAISAKRDRLAKGPNLGQMPSLSGGGVPATNTIQNIMDTDTLWQMAKREGKIR